MRRLVATVSDRKRVVPDSVELEGRGPVGGLPLYEDERVESARLLPVERVRTIVASGSSSKNERAFYELAVAHGRAVLAVRFR